MLIRGAQTLLLTTLGYATWRFGAVDTIVLVHLSLALLAITAMVALAMICFRYRVAATPIAILWPTLLFIGYGLTQTVPLPRSASPWANEVARVRGEFTEQPIDALDQAIVRFGGSAPAMDDAFLGSLIPYETRMAVVPLILAAVVAWLSSILFVTRRSRTVFLWCLLVHCAALAVWGIVQRAGGSLDLLPGTESPYRSLPFATFIYRNAGAAAVLPGIGAAIALMYANRSNSHSRIGSAYGPRNRWLSATDLSLVAIVAIVVIGIVVSLSRGAWISALVAFGLITILLGRGFRWHQVSAVVAIILAVAGVGMYQVTDIVQRRVDQFSIDDLTLDERWAHWKDGVATAIDHFPAGSGLGTYGYATLLNQSKPRNGWFREAHNQYLEVVTETGVVGVIALVGLIGFVIAACWQLRPRTVVRSGQREQQSWGLFAGAVMIFACVQSFGDFVIEIPANLLLYGCFVGIIARVAGESYAAWSKSMHHPSLGMARHAFVAIAIVVGLSYSMVQSQHELAGDIAIGQTPLSELADRPSDDVITQRLATLDHAIATQPDRATLYRHRAMWHFARYRNALIATAESEGESVPWVSTAPEIIFQSLAAMPIEPRQVTINAMTDRKLTPPLVEAVSDIARSLLANPLFIQSHFAGGQLASFTGMDSQPWIDRVATLSSPDPTHMYLAGILAWSNGDEGTAIRRWHDCLAVDSRFAQSIIPIAIARLSPLDVARHVIPRSQPRMQIELVRTVLTADTEPSPSKEGDTLELASKIAEEVIAGSTVDSEQRHAISATLLDLVGEKSKATTHWLAAVESAPMNPTYRFRAAEGLRSIGELDEALRHVVLGGTLSHNNLQFQNLAKRIRHDISKSKPSAP